MAKAVWIDYDPALVDLSSLIGPLEQEGYHITARAVDPQDEQAIIRQASQADAVVAQLECWNERTLSAVQGKVKIIVRFGMGMDSIDIPCATRLGIPVANIAGANAAAVAEIALLHILNCGRRFTHCTEGVRAGVWPSSLLGNELDGKTVGLFGIGNIARKLVQYLSGFQVRLLSYDPYVPQEKAPPNVTMTSSLEDLFSSSDIVSLHAPLTQETRGIVDRRLLGLMKPSAYLVNTSRGGVVNEPDLIEVLQTGIIRGAGLDVLTQEPPDPDNPLLKMDNVAVTSHLGANAWESDMRAERQIADTIICFFNGEHPRNILNRDVFR